MGNKSDLKESQQVNDDEAKAFAEELNGEFIKTSAKTSEGISELFNLITTNLLSQIKDNNNNKAEKKCICCDCFWIY